jgi:hypothetical protein
MEMHLDRSRVVALDTMNCLREMLLRGALLVHIPGYIQHSTQCFPELQLTQR